VLRLVFTYIDAAAPEREFVVGVRVLDDDATYQVTECTPAVDVMEPLLSTLNATGDLRGKRGSPRWVNEAALPASSAPIRVVSAQHSVLSR
jgi:hypothetical protein